MEIKKRKRPVVLLLGLLLAVFLSGCGSQQNEPEKALRVVTSVLVRCCGGSEERELHFFREESVQAILEYIRQLSPYGTPSENPETVIGNQFYITLIHSDGSTNTYHQLSDQMIRLDGGPWKRINEGLAGKLELLLRELSERDSPLPAPSSPLVQPELRG